ncbi:MAG: serine protease [Lachnospiraceae bacterium]|nr:serine protease [Lachnospiraceae bacterium]
MADEIYEKERQRIRERIVPRKHAKRVFLTILAVIGSAVLFGAVAAAMFWLTRTLFLSDSPNEPAAIVIARDDPRDASSGSTAASGETPQADPQESGSPGQDVKPGDGTGDRARYTSVKALYRDFADAFAEITVTETGTGDPIGDLLNGKDTLFGAAVAETASYLFILTDGRRIREGSRVTVRIGTLNAEASVVGTDSITDLCVLRVRKALSGQRYRVLDLGNSFLAEAGDPLYLVGAPENVPAALGEGMITRIVPYEPITDGYFQHIYTDLVRQNHGYGALFNADGELVGWFSDFASGSGTSVRALGISSVKYLVEDLCSGRGTVYLGILCTEIGEEEAAAAGVLPGLYVTEVFPDSPAFLAGIQPGDCILSMDGSDMDSNYTLQLQLDYYAEGSTATMYLNRFVGNEFAMITLTVTLGSRMESFSVAGY